MNSLAIDYGTKRIGLAISVNGIISPLPPIKNDTKTITAISQIIETQKINKIYIGLSEGEIATKTKKFMEKLRLVIKLDIETVEEAVSTIEADAIYKSNKRPKKKYKSLIDSVAAAVILRRQKFNIMIKNLISPIQAWLLSQGRCVACGTYLKHGQEKKIKDNQTITCKCGRIFIKTLKDNKVVYRRALFSEI